MGFSDEWNTQLLHSEENPNIRDAGYDFDDRYYGVRPRLPTPDSDDKYVVVPWFWITEDNLKLRVARDHVPYGPWQQQGFLQITEGKVVHYGAIEHHIEQLGERFDIREIAFDRWGAVQMPQNLEDAGLTVVPFGQGFKDIPRPPKS